MTVEDTHEAAVEGDGGVRRMEPQTAGMLLRQAREAAGLSLDAAAQQLKLAPRQVQALEDGDYARLPGRTFIRGFVRNYARMVHIDSETVLAALPAATGGPAPGIASALGNAPSIGEIPAGRAKAPWTRWAIPMTLITIVGAAAVYEYLRPADERASGSAGDKERTTAVRPAGERTATVRDAAPAVVAMAPATSRPSAPAPGASPPATSAPLALAPPASAPALASAPLTAPAPPATPAPSRPAPSPASSAPAIPEVRLDLEFRDFSWTEVRDRYGRVLMSKMMSAGQTQALSGAPPFDLVIGNATDVTLKFNGRPIDLAPYARQNVARFTLP